jgi:hypothetical protein
VAFGARALEEDAPADELRHDAAQRPGVHERVVVGLAQQHLRRHVPHRARPAVLLRRRIVMGHVQRHPEVAHPHDALIGADEDVLGLDVAVHDTERVHLLGARQQLPHRRSHRGLRQRRRVVVAAALVEEVAEAGADVLHDDAELRGPGRADEAVVADHERVAAARLQRSPLHAPPPPIVPGSGRERRDTLDGDELASGAAARLGDGAVAARAEGARLLVILRVADGHALPVADRHREQKSCGGHGGSWNLDGVEAWAMPAEEGGEKLNCVMGSLERSSGVYIAYGRRGGSAEFGFLWESDHERNGQSGWQCRAA